MNITINFVTTNAANSSKQLLPGMSNCGGGTQVDDCDGLLLPEELQVTYIQSDVIRNEIYPAEQKSVAEKISDDMYKDLYILIQGLYVQNAETKSRQVQGNTELAEANTDNQTDIQKGNMPVGKWHTMEKEAKVMQKMGTVKSEQGKNRNNKKTNYKEMDDVMALLNKY